MYIVKKKKNNSQILTKNFVDFQNFQIFNEDRILMETNIEILIIHKPSLWSRDVPQKIWARSVQPFWRLLDTNKQTNTQTDRQTDKPNLYIDVIFKKIFAVQFWLYPKINTPIDGKIFATLLVRLCDLLAPQFFHTHKYKKPKFNPLYIINVTHYFSSQ